jgi:membrane protein required for colicin V production
LNNIPLVPVDIFFIIVILFFTIRCIIKGFITELMSVASVVGGITAGFFFAPALSAAIDKYIGVSGWNRLISFLIIFLTVYIILKVIERGFYSLMERVSLEKLDRSLGLFLGLFEGLMIVIIIITVIDVQPLVPPEKILSGSLIAEYARKIIILIPEPNTIPPFL